MLPLCSGAHRKVRAAAAGLALMLGLGACGGDNLFRNSPPVTEGPPVVKELLVPEAVFEADVIPVRVEAVARRGLDSVVVLYRGALNTDQKFGFAIGTDSAVINTSVEVFQRLDSLLIISATATDAAGRTSNTLTDTVLVRQVSASAGRQ